jgi:hypothetical protein
LKNKQRQDKNHADYNVRLLELLDGAVEKLPNSLASDKSCKYAQNQR